jgi:hypothetical protein
VLLTKKVKVVKPLQCVLKLLNCKIIAESFNYKFNKNYFLPSKGITFYYGGWPSEKYFIDIKDDILKSYTFSKRDDFENLAYIDKINKTNSIAIHIRRGDYLNDENIKIFGNVCTKEYFEQAIKLIEKKVPNAHFFVFSNDVEWVKINLKIANVSYVTCNKGKNSWMDMYLMTICKHNIISNSTFSWWGAWLNTNASKLVISPNRYLNNDKHTDFYPESWIKLSDY